MAEPPVAPPACPLCEGVQTGTIATITLEQLLKAWEMVGARLSPEALGSLQNVPRIHLWHCHDCGFEFSHFDGAGGALFYEELQRQLPAYYPSNSPEYGRALKFGREYGLAEVLDVGCGAGAFLKLAKEAGLRTYGVELNPQAAANAREAGHTIYNELLNVIIARGGHSRFEFVTTWQVLEHVSDPVAFLRDCARFVKPGGYLAVAVPTEDGINSLSPGNPHFWPPHHTSRWRLKHLRQIGEKVGLRFVRGGNDPLDPYNARYMWELHNTLAPVFQHRPHPGGRIVPKLLAAFVARTRIHKLLPDWGHSTYAFFQSR
jgi:SAM-dependent methyltransferase